MATKKPAQPRQSWNVDFIQCELDKATKDHVKTWDPKFEATLDGLDRLIMDGYKVSLSLDKYHDCVGAFMTMPDQQHKSHGLCLAARGPSVLLALKVLVFKHFQILDGNWQTSNRQTGERDEWG